MTTIFQHNAYTSQEYLAMIPAEEKHYAAFGSQRES